jgi:hypothetical protein
LKGAQRREGRARASSGIRRGHPNPFWARCVWHCASGTFFDSSAKQGQPSILPFLRIRLQQTPVLITSHNSRTASDKTKRTYRGGAVSSASFIRNPIHGHTQIAKPTAEHRLIEAHTSNQTERHPAIGPTTRDGLFITLWIAANNNRVRGV